jgi:preprotein translocase subunit SecG
MTSRGTTNVLSRTTAILAAAFFATSLILSMIAGAERKPTSILNTNAPASAPAVPGAPQPPLGSGAGGVLDVLKQQGLQPGSQQPPAAPQQPSAPQVPQSQ